MNDVTALMFYHEYKLSPASNMYFENDDTRGAAFI